MKFWWVNQGKSYEIEHAGNFMWSPKKEKSDRRNQAYENMKLISPGDFIFSHFDKNVSVIGTAQSYCYEARRPEEFPKNQNEGNYDGWRVDVQYFKTKNNFYPKLEFKNIKDFLPEKYSPLDKDGKAAQKLYVTNITNEFAEYIMNKLNIEVSVFPKFDHEISKEDFFRQQLEESQIYDVLNDKNLSETEKITLSKARVGQGKFRELVSINEKKCRITGIDIPEFLIASHIKPWRLSSNVERVDQDNGLFLTPTIDKLFDRYFISFSNDGKLIISPLLSNETRMKFNLVENAFVGDFSEGQKKYLSHHRERLRK